MYQIYFGKTASTLVIGKKLVNTIYESIPESPYIDDAKQLLSAYGKISWLDDTAELPKWNPETEPIDFRKMSSPDTTFCLVMAYDSKNPDNCPKNALTTMVDAFSEFSDHVERYDNTDATAAVFLQKLQEGIQYHNFYFYEFSHGANYYISLKGGVTRDQFWNAIQNAQNRFIGIFDSCDSGSMLIPNSSNSELSSSVFPSLSSTYSSTNLMSATTVEKKESFIEYIARKFNEKKKEKARLFSAGQEEKEPMFQLWSATEESHYGWYYPKDSTVFARAFKNANNQYKDSRLSTMWSKVKQLGSYNTGYPDDNINKAIPQRVCYGEDFDQNITWI